MSRLRVVPIVEGHGENESIRILLQRIWTEIVGGEYIEVLRPIRRPRSKLAAPAELANAVKLAWLKLRHAGGEPDPGFILVLVDRDPDREPPCVSAPHWLENARAGQPDADITCVLADVEYETWFVAAADSLREELCLTPADVLPEDADTARTGKSWIQSRIKRRGRPYSETLDQPSLTAKMDLTQCRQRSRSFDKLCRELEKRCGRRPVTESDAASDPP